MRPSGGRGRCLDQRPSGYTYHDGLVPMSYSVIPIRTFDLESIIPRVTIMAGVLQRISSDDRYLRRIEEE